MREVCSPEQILANWRIVLRESLATPRPPPVKRQMFFRLETAVREKLERGRWAGRRVEKGAGNWRMCVELAKINNHPLP